MPWLAILVAVIVAASSLRNGFTYDDIPIVVDNARVTTLQAPWAYFTQSYWPTGGLFRPVAVLILSLQWRLGAGAPWLFHGTNIVLNAAIAGLVYILARRVMAPGWAMLASLLFAVHPVHVEAVANVVGLSELLCTGLVLGSVLLALQGLASEFNRWYRLGVLALAMLAALSKETGFVTPALLLVAAGIAGTPPGLPSLKRIAPLAFVSGLLLAALLVYRASVLGAVAGDQPAAPFQGLTWLTRGLVSLGIAPDWVRLLVWPARLSFDYSPPGYPVGAEFGMTHLAGVLLLGAIGWLAWTTRRHAPAIILGVAWAAIAILPVSNLLVPTGVLLAERTLYLASVGAVLAIAGAADLVWRRLPVGWFRRLAQASTAAALLAGGARSAARANVWRSNDTLLAQVDVEAAENYRAHRTRALYLDRQGRLDGAEREYRRSIALWGRDAQVYEDLAILLHRRGREAEVAEVLAAGLGVAPAAPVMRGKLYYLQVARGEWRSARATAADGLALGDSGFAPLVRRADSALATVSPVSPAP